MKSVRLLWFVLFCALGCDAKTTVPTDAPIAAAKPPKVSRIDTSDICKYLPRGCKPKAEAVPIHKVGGSFPRPPVVPSSWLQPAWFVDPAGGNDKNTCITSGSPCKHWSEVVARLGTNAPTLRQSTTVTFLSSQTDDSDPVVWKPVLANQAQAALQGNLDLTTQVATGTLGSVTVKNRATPQLLQADLGASAAVGMFVVNSTKSSYAWVYQNVSGNVFALSQPNAPIVHFVDIPNEDDTWANGDSFTLYQPVRVDLVELSARVANYNPAFSNILGVYHLTAMDPSGTPGSNGLRLGEHVALDEMHAEVFVAYDAVAVGEDNSVGLINVYAEGGYLRGYQTGADQFSHNVIGGIMGSPNAFFFGVCASYIDNDVILGPLNAFALNSNLENVLLGTMYVASGTTLRLRGIDRLDIGTNILWGPGNLDLAGPARVVYAAGSGGAALFQLTGSFLMDGLTTAYSICGTTLHAGVTVSGAHLDATCGAAGFGGFAYNFGGASITDNVGP